MTDCIDDYKPDKCPVLIIYLLLKHIGGLGLEKEDWFAYRPNPCFFKMTPRFLAFVSFYFASMGNDFLESREKCLSRAYMKMDSGILTFSKGAKAKPIDFLVLSEVLTFSYI